MSRNIKSKYMKFKLLILITFFSLIFFNVSFGQRQKTLAKFIITDATINGEDVTPILLANNAYIVFYTSDDDGLIYMANVFPESNAQIYGAIYSAESQTQRETYETYAADIFYFNWRYINIYDNKKGTVKVEMIKIYKPQGVVFAIKMIPENLGIIVYKGYMEGTLYFSE